MRNGAPSSRLWRLDEFVTSRVVEAVIHGLDLTDALGIDPLASEEAVTTAAQVLDDLLARRTVAGRPANLSDNREWVRVASGRAEHDDPSSPDRLRTPRNERSTRTHRLVDRVLGRALPRLVRTRPSAGLSRPRNPE